MARIRTALPRRGFTLIEMLIVVAVLGMLISLGGFAAFQALRSARQSSIIFEIGQLSRALDAYKEQHGSYPPCMNAYLFASGGTPSAVPANSGYQTRQNLLTIHMRTGYPVNLSSSGYAHSTTSLKTLAHSPYQYKNASGQPANLDMDKMDAAESLVFWLGGFPCPYRTGGYICSQKLVGFRTDSSNPWIAPTNDSTLYAREATLSGDAFLAMRTKPLFDFDESRLVDADQDGWLEYVPEKVDPNGDPSQWPPPYVYFDAGTYGLWHQTMSGSAPMIPQLHAYPSEPGQIPNQYGFPGLDPILSTTAGGLGWGTAVPYARSVDGPTGRIQWINPDTFQIICAGLDHQYSSPANSGNSDPFYRIRATIYASPPSMGMTSQHDLRPVVQSNGAYPLGMEERDNLSNFTDRPFGADLGY